MGEHINDFEQYARLLFGRDWNKTSEIFRLLIAQAQEVINSNEKSSDEKGPDSLQNEDAIGVLFPSYYMIKIIEKSLFPEGVCSEPNRDFSVADNASKENTAFNEAFTAYSILMDGALKVIGIALSNFQVATHKWRLPVDGNKAFSKWIECADEAHEDWILTSKFSENFGKCCNYHFSRTALTSKV